MANNERRLLENSWIDSYLKLSSNHEAPEIFHYWTAISAIAAALGRDVWIDQEHFVYYPNFYIILVSAAGRCRKGAAIGIAEPILKTIDKVRFAPSLSTPEGLIDFMRGAPAKKFADGTILEQAHAFVCAKELMNFMSDIKYKKGMLSFITDAWDCGDVSVLTRSRGYESAENSCLNMVGGSNPQWLAQAVGLGDIGGGFLSRCIMVYSDTPRQRIAFPKRFREKHGDPKTKPEELISMLTHDLHQISRLEGEFRYTPEAYEYLEHWYEQVFKADPQSSLTEYYERKFTHINKLSMIASASFNNSMVIELGHAMLAHTLIEKVETTMEQAYKYIGSTPEARIAQEMLDFIRKNDGFVEKHILYRRFRHLVKSMRDMIGTIDVLKHSRLLVEKKLSGNRSVYMLTTASIKKLVAEKSDGKKQKQSSFGDELVRIFGDKSKGRIKAVADETVL